MLSLIEQARRFTYELNGEVQVYVMSVEEGSRPQISFEAGDKAREFWQRAIQEISADTTKYEVLDKDTFDGTFEYIEKESGRRVRIVIKWGKDDLKTAKENNTHAGKYCDLSQYFTQGGIIEGRAGEQGKVYVAGSDTNDLARISQIKAEISRKESRIKELVAAAVTAAEAAKYRESCDAFSRAIEEYNALYPKAGSETLQKLDTLLQEMRDSAQVGALAKRGLLVDENKFKQALDKTVSLLRDSLSSPDIKFGDVYQIGNSRYVRKFSLAQQAAGEREFVVAGKNSIDEPASYSNEAAFAAAVASSNIVAAPHYNYDDNKTQYRFQTPDARAAQLPDWLLERNTASINDSSWYTTNTLTRYWQNPGQTNYYQSTRGGNVSVTNSLPKDALPVVGDSYAPTNGFLNRPLTTEEDLKALKSKQVEGSYYWYEDVNNTGIYDEGTDG
jgi:hypothetical protein